nr:unnamed protein product [Callosobruchus chinensis]
MQKRQATQPAP